MTERRKARSIAALGVAAGLGLTAHGGLNTHTSAVEFSQANVKVTSFKRLRNDLALTTLSVVPIQTERFGKFDTPVSLSTPSSDMIAKRLSKVEIDLEKVDLDRNREIAALRSQLAQITSIESTRPALEILTDLTRDAQDKKEYFSHKYRRSVFSYMRNFAEASTGVILGLTSLGRWKKHNHTSTSQFHGLTMPKNKVKTEFEEIMREQGFDVSDK